MYLPTAYFPNTAYFFHLLKHKDVCICAHEAFQKQTYRNRCTILNANGLQDLTVPVGRDHEKNAHTYSIEISYAENWRKNHLRSLESAYRRTPYYEYYIESLEKILLKDHRFLHNLNYELIVHLAEKIGLSCNLLTSTEELVIPLETQNLVNPKVESTFIGKSYIQTFTERFGFQNNLSILDLLFNEGPNSICILQESTGKIQ